MSNTPPSSFDVSRCPKLTAFGLEPELARIFNRSMLVFQEQVSAIKAVASPKTERGALQWWTVQYAILLFGSCDAARVLVTHNLQREAWLSTRQAFEFTMRAIYFYENQDKALMEIRAEALRRFAFLKQSGITKGRLFNARKAEAEAAIAAFPEVEQFELVPFEQMISNENGERAKTYALHYRMPSQVAHGTVLSFQETMAIGEGLIQTAFDSRQNDGTVNDMFGTLINYLLTFCDLVARAFGLKLPSEVAALLADNRAVDLRLNPETFEHMIKHGHP